MNPISRVFFRWVGSTTNQNVCYLLVKFPGCILLKNEHVPQVRAILKGKLVFQRNQGILGDMLKFRGCKIIYYWSNKEIKCYLIGVFVSWSELGVSKNSGIPKSSILIGFSIIFTIHILGYHYFWKPPNW